MKQCNNNNKTDMSDVWYYEKLIIFKSKRNNE